MKLFTSIGPNPHVVRMFLAEKGVSYPTQEVDLMSGENRQPDYLKVNARGQSPALVLDDGSVVAEITAICEYVEDVHPAPPLIGSTAAERAETRMWTRRLDLGVCEPMANGFRFGEGLKMFSPRIRCLPEASAGLKAIAQDTLGWLDGQIAGRTWIAGERFTLADIMLFCFLNFGARVGQKIDPAHGNVAAWFERAKARPSAAA
jgi:glutathione S-transferase